MYAAPIGVPGLVAFFAGALLFVTAMVAARRRRGREAAGGTVSRLSRAGIAVQALGIVAVGVGPFALVLPAGSTMAIAAAVAVAALMTGTVALFASATRAMGRNWSVVARTRADHELVEAGPFAHVRHPIYVALALFTLAMAVAYGHLAHLWAAAPLYVLGTALRVREEERLLRARFGTAYNDYAQRVARFVPGLF